MCSIRRSIHASLYSYFGVSTGIAIRADRWRRPSRRPVRRGNGQLRDNGPAHRFHRLVGPWRPRQKAALRGWQRHYRSFDHELRYYIPSSSISDQGKRLINTLQLLKAGNVGVCFLLQPFQYIGQPSLDGINVPSRNFHVIIMAS